MTIQVPAHYRSSQTATAYVHGYNAGYAGNIAQVYGGKLTKAAYLDGWRAGMAAAIAKIEA